jgi:GT2 family glycosyltransferase
VFSVLEAAVLMPTRVFEDIGGWGDPYFYAHEGIELAWRVWNAGKTVWYAGDMVVHHPVTSPTRHATYYRLNARNRVWLAKRNLPRIMIPFYVLAWTGVQLVRAARSGGAGLGPWFSGWLEGWRVNPGGRVGMRWLTVARMTKAGRFPIL